MIKYLFILFLLFLSSCDNSVIYNCDSIREDVYRITADGGGVGVIAIENQQSIPVSRNNGIVNCQGLAHLATGGEAMIVYEAYTVGDQILIRMEPWNLYYGIE